MKYTFILFLFICLASCKSDSKNTTSGSDSELAPGSTEQAFRDLNVPALPTSLMQELKDQATYIDYIFYDLPFSISQDDKPSIASNLEMISPDGIEKLPMNCKPIGREFFHIGGIIKYEADLYFSNDCAAYVFLKDEKPIYANKISNSGSQFYNNLITQAQQIKAKAINGE